MEVRTERRKLGKGVSESAEEEKKTLRKRHEGEKTKDMKGRERGWWREKL